jgi:hypothetical protein
MAIPSWRKSLRQEIRRPASLAPAKAGRSIPARMAIMAMTTNSSIRVKPSLSKSAPVIEWV